MAVSFYHRQEMPDCETEMFAAATELGLFRDTLHDALKGYTWPSGWTWYANGAAFRLTATGVNRPNSIPNPLTCDAGAVDRDHYQGVIATLARGGYRIGVTHFSMKALCKVPGRMDITAHFTPEGKPLLDYLVKALDAAGFPGKTPTAPALEFPESDQAGEPRKKPGRPRFDLYDWAWQEINTKGRDKEEVYVEFVRRYAEDTGRDYETEQTDPRSSFGEAMSYRNQKNR